MSDDMDELSPEVRALLRAELTIDPLPSEAIARMHARVRSELPPGDPTGGGPSSPGSPSAPASPSPSTAAGRALARAWSSMHGGSLAVGLAIGAIVGAGAAWWIGGRGEPTHSTGGALAESVSPVASAPEPAASASPPAVAPVDPAGGADTSERSEARHAPRRRPSPPHAPTDRLAEERRIVDAARTAIASGHAGEGLDVLRRHASEFGTGSLAEERDALEIRALLDLGRVGEARIYAEGFRAAHPASIFWPAIHARLARESRER